MAEGSIGSEGEGGARQTVVAALVTGGVNERELFLARRSRNGSSGGLWELPGGKVEAGEGAEAALVREIREELGVGLLSLGSPRAYDLEVGERSYRFLVLPAAFDSKRFSPSVHDECGWFKATDIPWAELAPFDAEALRDWVAGKFEAPGLKLPAVPAQRRS
jgi:8-oxo-dGTP diphosphatase